MPLAMLGAGGVKGSLPCVRLIVRKLVRDNAALFFSL
jgi:hypothetical protein